VVRLNQMKKKTTILASVFLISTLTACAQYKVDQQLVAEPDPVALRLSAAVDKASAALQTLASVEQARNPGVSLQMPPSAPQELRRIVSVDWVGPIEPITRSLADRAGYKIQINGDVPPVPVVVSIVAREKSVIEVLRDIGLQAGTRADVSVDPSRRIVEINYAPVSGG
jgi:defect-in-organelle-trafficking protein DotD